jgi:hypothetical protein
MKLKYSIYISLLICLMGMSACSGATPVPTPTLVPSATAPATWTFDHPQRIYSLRFPAGWRQEVISHGKGYEEVYFKTSNYRVSEGYPVLEEGADFFIWVQLLPQGVTTASEYINAHPLLDQVARDRKQTSVAGYPAIQCDYSYEGVRAVLTFFAAHGKIFQVRYRFVDDASRPEYLQEYEDLLKSMVVYNIQ